MLSIPTYNERDNIATLVSRIRGAVGNEPILFIDDNSPDGTAEEIRRIQASDPNIHLLARPGKAGFGSACRDAMKKTLRENLADYLIQMDADLSHPPELLPTMIEMLQSHPVVIGSRYIAGGGANGWDARRHFLSFGANLYARTLTGIPAHDLTAGFVGYRSEALRPRFHPHRRVCVPDGDEVLPAQGGRAVRRIPHHLPRTQRGQVEVHQQDSLRRDSIPAEGAGQKVQLSRGLHRERSGGDDNQKMGMRHG